MYMMGLLKRKSVITHGAHNRNSALHEPTIAVKILIQIANNRLRFFVKNLLCCFEDTA